MKRRLFLQSAALTSFLASVPRWVQGAWDLLPIRMGATNPVAKVDSFQSEDFNGDDISRPHDILWNKDGYLASKGGVPPVSEKVPVVVIGGGISGLLSAYFLRDKNPLLLEQAPQFGGNSKGESLGGSQYSIGAAYVVKPDAGSELEKLFNDLSLTALAREEKSEDLTVFFQKQFKSPFWEGATDPDFLKEFQRIQTDLKFILENQYPDIPHTAESALSDEQFRQLDSVSFKAWMAQQWGSVHPHIEEYFQLYAWSSFCASLDEVSAAQMLNFIAAETESIWTFPGGNSAIAERLHQRLTQRLGEHSLRAGCFVLDVSVFADGVRVVYEDSNRKLKTVWADACVFAAPKFVAERVISQLPAEQIKAINSISYRAYLVANVLLKKKILSPAFDLYLLQGAVPERPMAMNPGARQFTDVCFGSWAQEPHSERGVITVYKALPYDGARQFLFNPLAHAKNKKQVEQQVPEILSSLRLTPEDIAGIRMTRWGHALPVARVGALSSGLADLASQSVGTRLHFANQDNWLNPAFESSFAAAQQATEKVLRVLR